MIGEHENYLSRLSQEELLVVCTALDATIQVHEALFRDLQKNPKRLQDILRMSRATSELELIHNAQEFGEKADVNRSSNGLRLLINEMRGSSVQ